MDPILLACGGDHDLRQHHHWPGWHLRVSDLVGSSPRPSTARSLLFALDLVAFDPLKNILTSTGGSLGTIVTPAPRLALIRAYRPWHPLCLIFMSIRGYFNMVILWYFLDGCSIQHTISKLWWTSTSTLSDNVDFQTTFQHNATASALRDPGPQPAFRTQLDIQLFQTRADLVEYPFDK